MVTNEKRKEVAAKLRVLASHVPADAEMVLDALDLYEGECIEGFEPRCVERLADLIEPERTCRVEEVGVVDESGYYLSGITRDKCSNCGFVDDPQMWAEVYDYCPKCGTKVVE